MKFSMRVCFSILTPRTHATPPPSAPPPPNANFFKVLSCQMLYLRKVLHPLFNAVMRMNGWMVYFKTFLISLEINMDIFLKNKIGYSCRPTDRIQIQLASATNFDQRQTSFSIGTRILDFFNNYHFNLGNLSFSSFW